MVLLPGIMICDHQLISLSNWSCSGTQHSWQSMFWTLERSCSWGCHSHWFGRTALADAEVPCGLRIHCLQTIIRCWWHCNKLQYLKSRTIIITAIFDRAEDGSFTLWLLQKKRTSGLNLTAALSDARMFGKMCASLMLIHGHVYRKIWYTQPNGVVWGPTN